MKKLIVLPLVLCLISVGRSRLYGAEAAIEVVTNGIYASGEVVNYRVGHMPYYVVVTYRFTPPNTNVNTSVFQHGPLPAIFFMPTNSFCGWVRLRDSQGDEIPLLKRQINSPSAYPASYDLREMAIVLDRLVGTGPPLPYAIGGEVAHSSFSLNDYFKPEKPGKYQLTVWPMMYKRTNDGSGICYRIDLPPVTIPIDYSNIPSDADLGR